MSITKPPELTYEMINAMRDKLMPEGPIAVSRFNIPDMHPSVASKFNETKVKIETAIFNHKIEQKYCEKKSNYEHRDFLYHDAAEIFLKAQLSLLVADALRSGKNNDDNKKAANFLEPEIRDNLRKASNYYLEKSISSGRIPDKSLRIYHGGLFQETEKQTEAYKPELKPESEKRTTANPDRPTPKIGGDGEERTQNVSKSDYFKEKMRERLAQQQERKEQQKSQEEQKRSMKM